MPACSRWDLIQRLKG